MRAIVTLAVLPFLILSGCYTEVHGDPPRSACGEDGALARSVILGSHATWAGRTLTAEEDGVTLWVDGGEGSVGDEWFGEETRAWGVVAVAPGGEVVQGRAGLIQYNGERTTVRIGPAGQTLPDDGRMIAAHEIIGPITLDEGDSVLVAGAADQTVTALALHLRWQGCARTGEILFGIGSGFVAGWGEMEGPFAVSNAGTGTLAYESKLTRESGAAVVLAQPPPGGDSMEMNEAHLTTSRDTVELTGLTFVVHDGGAVQYEVTHVGPSGKEPLLAVLPIEFAAAGPEWKAGPKATSRDPPASGRTLPLDLPLLG